MAFKTWHLQIHLIYFMLQNIPLQDVISFKLPVPVLFLVFLPLQTTRQRCTNLLLPWGFLVWERRLGLDLLPLLVAIDFPKPNPCSKAESWLVGNVGAGEVGVRGCQGWGLVGVICRDAGYFPSASCPSVACTLRAGGAAGVGCILWDPAPAESCTGHSDLASAVSGVSGWGAALWTC